MSVRFRWRGLALQRHVRLCPSERVQRSDIAIVQSLRSPLRTDSKLACLFPAHFQVHALEHAGVLATNVSTHRASTSVALGLLLPALSKSHQV